MRTSILVTGSVAALLLLSSCRKQDSLNEAVTTGPRDPRLSVKAGGYHGNHFSGPVYIPRSSPMDEGTSAYNVVYQDGVTVLSRG